MNDFDFIQTSAKDIHNLIIENLENDIGESLYPGDERRIFADALSYVMVLLFNKINDACRQKLLRFARGEVLDEYGEMNDAIRNEGIKASVIMQFGLKEPIETPITIPAGTRVTSDFEYYYETIENATIQAGQLFVDLDCKAEQIGEAYNGYEIGSINILVDQIPYIDYVRNITITEGGTNEEDDETYRDRIRRRSSSFSTAGPRKAYYYHTLSADASIIDASVFRDEPGSVTVVPICKNGELPTEDVLQKVRDVLNDELIRPLTDRVIVTAPEIVTYNIQFTYYTTAKDESKCVEAVEGEDGAIQRYIKWQQSELGKSINPDQLRKLVLSPDWNDLLVGATRINLDYPTYQTIQNTQIPKIGTITVNHIVEG